MQWANLWQSFALSCTPSLHLVWAPGLNQGHAVWQTNMPWRPATTDYIITPGCVGEHPHIQATVCWKMLTWLKKTTQICIDIDMNKHRDTNIENWHWVASIWGVNAIWHVSINKSRIMCPPCWQNFIGGKAEALHWASAICCNIVPWDDWDNLQGLQSSVHLLYHQWFPKHMAYDKKMDLLDPFLDT